VNSSPVAPQEDTAPTPAPAAAPAKQPQELTANPPPLELVPSEDPPHTPISKTPTDINFDEMELQAMDHPPAIFNCPGHWVIRASDPYREGLIESVDLESQAMEVVYEDEPNSNRFSSVVVSYGEPDLQWYEEAQPSSTSRSSLSPASDRLSLLFTRRNKPPYDRVVGCYILLEDTGDEALAPADLALVVNVTDTKKKLLKVQFVQKISRDGRVVCDEEVEEVEYATKSLIWLTGKLISS
jgi:hypothetical protein